MQCDLCRIVQIQSELLTCDFSWPGVFFHIMMMFSLIISHKSFSEHNFFLFHFVLQAPSIDEKVDLHFIALVNVGGHLYELGKNTFYLLSPFV